MESAVTRDEAFELLEQYNKEPFHIQHALTVEGVMKWYANELGFGQEEDYWGITGLLHGRRYWRGHDPLCLFPRLWDLFRCPA